MILSCTDEPLGVQEIDSPDSSLFSYEIVNTFPHDPEAFTQGLVFHDGFLYEGTGLNGHSTVRKVKLETGEILQTSELPSQFFGEGITIFNEKIIQLTWVSHTGFVYSKESFQLLQEFSYETQGWGITHDGEHLIMSDGTANLYFRDPNSFEEVKRVEVFDEEGPIQNLNELEYINGQIFANVWKTDKIAWISPETGEVLSWINLTGLLSGEDRTEPVDVLNGIAYDADRGRLFVTGKLWPKIFEIRLVPQT